MFPVGRLLFRTCVVMSSIGSDLSDSLVVQVFIAASYGCYRCYFYAGSPVLCFSLDGSHIMIFGHHRLLLSRTLAMNTCLSLLTVVLGERFHLLVA